MEELVKLNIRLGQAEKTKDERTLQEILAEELVFRRASGAVVNKESFFEALKNINYHALETEILAVQPLSSSLLMATVKVFACGENREKPFVGEYLNFRFFKKCENGWQLYAWHNRLLASEKDLEASFSGKVWRQLIPSASSDNLFRAQEVFFAPNSRTYWHLHPEGQDLYILSGKAVVGFKHGNAYILQAGEHIHILPGTLHWHGALEKGMMSHLAVNKFTLDSPTTFWFDEVVEI